MGFLLEVVKCSYIVSCMVGRIVLARHVSL
jgi:hypothetical protein